VTKKERQYHHYHDALSEQQLVKQLHEKEEKRLRMDFAHNEKIKLERAGRHGIGGGVAAENGRLKEIVDKKMQVG